CSSDLRGRLRRRARRVRPRTRAGPTGDLSVGDDVGADALAPHGAGDVVRGVETEDHHLLRVVHAQTEGGGIDDLQATLQRLVVGDPVQLGRLGVRARIGIVDAVDPASQTVSKARRTATVSVEKAGTPTPAPKMTTRPFSRWRTARSGM